MKYVFLQFTLATINVTLLFNTFCNLLLPRYSSEFSPIMPDEFEGHLTRDQRPFQESIYLNKTVTRFQRSAVVFNSWHGKHFTAQMWI